MVTSMLFKLSVDCYIGIKMKQKTPKNQSQVSSINAGANGKNHPDTLRGSYGKILKEMRKRVRSMAWDKEVGRERFIQGAMTRIEEAISLTRQDCEKKFILGWQTESFYAGQKAERERIWQILKKLYQPRFAFKVMNATQGKQESDDWFRGYNDAIKSELKIEEELKKEIMKDDRT